MLVLAGLAFGAALWCSNAVYSGRLLLPEEGSFLFQAGNFLDGTHSREPGALAPLLDYPTMRVTEKDWMSRFAPGHAFWLVPGVWVDGPRVMSALAAALTMASMYGIGWRLRMPRFLLPALLLLSPFFLFLHGTLLAQSSAMAFSGLLLMAYMKWRQERGIHLAFFAGFCWSLLACIRPYSACWIGVPFLVDALLETKRARRSAAAWAALGLFLLAGLIGVWAVLRYNDLSTGNPLMSPYLEYEPSETWGFGPRRLQGGDVAAVDHSLQRGFVQLWRNLLSLDRWMLGTPAGTLVVWLALVAHGWSRRWSGLLFGAVWAVLLGHVAFWDDGISPIGPLQLAEVLPFALLLGGLGLSRIWRRMHNRHPQRVALFGLLLLVVGYASVRFSVERTRRIGGIGRRAWQTAALVAALPEPALAFLPGEVDDGSVLHTNTALNPRGFDSDVLRLQASSEDRAALAAAFPHRTAHVLKLEPRVHPDLFTETWSGLDRVAANSHHSRGTGENEGDARVVGPGTDTPGFLFFGWYPHLPPGAYTCRFDLRWSGVTAGAPLRLELSANEGETVLGARELGAGLEETVIRFELDEVARVEPRVYYGGTGTVTLRKVEIRAAESAGTGLGAQPVQ